ncbi:type II secretory pathway, ATPase PulE/Tfp pilus assembly pathway, ATPase PilB [Frateuria aurantia DSM 6220]|uniref:Type II secretory pathway, ATPase PulE/Tfp pilus assembly pathway, ATPase PilB n=1 Tax=Frateuria aurantia (strain ATCC 33424 / DSM 6220 / KCTC 2777 / LMG 1558 / NBRC 3245 / NCIMB 13370) TaxID=767434 RepID=H8L0N2_FRAAD|nr:type II secretory pathway, ATPase PulE/Tfp pilus assembly pathway, ATPase PilB [Frateuria aurantia DSM 6220]
MIPSLSRTTGLSDSRGRLQLPGLLAALVADGLVRPEDAARLSHVRRDGASPEVHPLVLLARAHLPDAHDPLRSLGLETLTEWLAGRAGLPYLRIDPMKITPEATQSVSQAYAGKHGILPVAADREALVFATAEPFDQVWADDLAQMLRREVRRVVANPLDIQRYQLEFYQVQRSIQMARESKASAAPNALPNFEQLLELGKSGEVGADDRHVVHIVDWLLQYAFEQRASDLHLEPRREAGRVRFRIDGVMQQVFELPPPVMMAVTSRVKILARMDVAEKRRPQDGRIKTRSGGAREVELRISSMPTAFGEKLVMRVFDPDVVMKDFGQLGFSPEEQAIWEQLIGRPHGIVLVTGPTGSGKTTTLYSTLKRLARPEINVCTVEDPIEMVVPELNQMQVQPAIDLDFAAGVRTLLRQDPDIIMVGEIRDLETAQMAVQAALTGHLVLSTLHTNDAPSAVTRLLDLGVPHYLIQSTLAGVVAQRLIRVLCPHCKRPARQDPAEWAALTAGWDLPCPEQVQAPGACIECRQTGFLGRVGIYEMLPIGATLRARITAGMELGRIAAVARAGGLKPLRIAAARQVVAGLSTVHEVMSCLPPVEEAAMSIDQASGPVTG